MYYGHLQMAQIRTHKAITFLDHLLDVIENMKHLKQQMLTLNQLKGLEIQKILSIKGTVEYEDL